MSNSTDTEIEIIKSKIELLNKSISHSAAIADKRMASLQTAVERSAVLMGDLIKQTAVFEAQRIEGNRRLDHTEEGLARVKETAADNRSVARIAIGIASILFTAVVAVGTGIIMRSASGG